MNTPETCETAASGSLVDSCPLCALASRGPHVVRALLLIAAAVVLAAITNQVNFLGLPWRLPASGRPGIPRVLERQLVEVKAAQARALLQAGQVIVLDSRDAKDYRLDHIAGAISVPMRDWEKAWPKVKDALPKDRVYLLYCYGAKCGLSTREAKRLAVLGYPHLLILEHGWKEWQEAGYPTIAHPQGPEKKR